MFDPVSAGAMAPPSSSGKSLRPSRMNENVLAIVGFNIEEPEGRHTGDIQQADIAGSVGQHGLPRG